MKISIPHQLGDDLAEPTEGQEICVRIDGTVETNEDGSLVLDVTDVSIEDYSEEDGDGDYEEDDDEKMKRPQHAIVIGIVKKK